MKNQLSILTVFLLATTAPGCAGAFLHGSPANGGGTVNCPNPPPDGEDDGCVTATHVGLYKDANWFTNTVNWNDVTVTPPSWNVAYVQYGVGQYTATGSLANPSAGGLSGQGCAYDSPTHTLNCTGSGALSVTGYYFNDMVLYVHGSYTSVSIVGNKFLNGSVANTQFNLVRIDDEGVSTTLVDDWNTYDQAGDTGINNAAQVFGDNRTTAHSGATEHHYNAVLNTTSKFLIQDGCVDPNLKFNAYLGWPAPSGDTNHAEVSLVCHKAETMATYTSWFNTGWEPRDQDATGTPAGGTTAIDFMTAGAAYGQTYTQIDVRYNVYNINLNNNLVPASGIVSGEVMGIQAGTYVNCLWKKNYLFGLGAFFLVADSSSGCATTWTSNVNMRTGAAISAYNTVP